MSDDSFIREVEEEIRSDRMKSIWERFGTLIIAAAFGIVVLVAANSAWTWYTDGQATASGDRFRQALTSATEGNTDQALEQLRALQEDGYGQYPVLARMREATLLDNSGDRVAAVEAFDAIAADTSVPAVLRDVARLRAAYIMVDEGTYDDVANRAEPLAGDDNPMRHGAREALGLAAWKAQNYGDAKRLFDQIVADEAVPPTTAQRANVMLDIIRATGEVTEG